MTTPVEAAERALRMVRECRHLSYDTEGTGLDWRKNSVVGYVVGAPDAPGGTIAQDDVVYVPIRHGGGGNLLGGKPMQTPEDKIEIHDFERALALAFDDRNRTFGADALTIGHHIKFDAHFSANSGVMLGRHLSDTQDRAALLDEYQGSYSLENCAKIAGVEAKKGTELYEHLARLFGGKADRSQMSNFWRTSGTDPVAQEYARGDGVSTYQLWIWQQSQIEEQELGVVDRLEGDLIWTCFRAERTGIRVDLDRVERLRRAVESKISQQLTEFPLGFNVRSGSQIKALMIEHGYTDWPKTDLGNPSFTEKWLKNNPVGRGIVKIRQYSNLIHSFIEPLVRTHCFNGRVHATLNQMKSDDTGTISGRFSCSGPNLQQVPKRVKELAIPFRRLFVADEGTFFWERDFSQAEPRTFAEYSQDPNLMAGYLAEPFVDAHQTVANLLEVDRDYTAKRMNMGIFTGMQTRSFAGHMGWTLEKATEAHNAWFAAFPGIKQFQINAKNRLLKRGYVKTVLGRRGRLEHPRFAYRGTSKVIQGTDADIMKWKLLEGDKMCEQAGDIVRILMTVHDSYEGTAEESAEGRRVLNEIVAEMQDVQKPPFNFKVPFLLEGFEGGGWAEATFGPDKVQKFLEEEQLS